MFLKQKHTKKEFSHQKKLRKLFVLALFSTVGFTTSAQQNIFNVPSVEVTSPNKIFFQQQFNVGTTIQSNTTFDYGLKRNMEVGFNLFNINYSTRSERMVVNPGKDSATASAFSPLLLINFLKQWQISDAIKIGAGTQMGSSLPVYGKAKYAGFYYVSSSCAFFKEHLKTDAGIFYGNRYYLGSGYTPGVMLGYEWSILHDRVHLTGDWLSGAHDLGEAVVGLVLYPQKSIPISIGYQFPNSKAGNQALVLELTYVQSHHKKRKQEQ